MPCAKVKSTLCDSKCCVLTTSLYSHSKSKEQFLGNSKTMSQVASTGVYLAVSLTHISKEIYNLLVEIHIAYVKHILSHFLMLDDLMTTMNKIIEVKFNLHFILDSFS